MDNETVSKNFIENIIDKDLADGVYDTVHTRFPPEPNGCDDGNFVAAGSRRIGMADTVSGISQMKFPAERVKSP